MRNHSCRGYIPTCEGVYCGCTHEYPQLHFQVATKPGSELAETSCEKRRQDTCGAKICARHLLAIKNGDVIGIILRWWLFPPTGCSRAHTHTAECAFCTVFYSVFCFCTMLPWGGRGGGRNNWCNWWYRGGMLTFHVTCSRCWCYATLGWGGMLAFHVTCSRCWCYATLGWGRDVNVPCNLLTLLMLRHPGVGRGC